MTKVLISGYYGMGNTGDEAILSAFVDHARSMFPDCRITALSGNPDSTRAIHGIDAVQRWDMPGILKAIRDSDLFVSGGGSLLQDVTGQLTIPYYLGLMVLAMVIGIPVSIYAQGLGPIRSPIYRAAVRKVCLRASTVSVRDEDSGAFLESAGVANYSVLADPAFGLEPAGDGGAEDGCAAFSLRPWSLHTDIEQAYADCVDYVKEELGLTPIMLAFQPEMDLPLAEAVSARSRSRPAVIPCPADPRSALGFVSRMEMVIGMRLHSLIFAAASCVPAVGIGYDPKVSSLMKYMDLGSYVPWDKVGHGLIEAAESTYRRREAISDWLSGVIPVYREKAIGAARLALSPLGGGG